MVDKWVKMKRKEEKYILYSMNVTGEANGLIYTHAEYAEIETKVLIS
jgi:hypothetical protein